MEITQVRIYLTEEGHVMAYASIVLDEAFIIRDLKVIRMGGKTVVAMPRQEDKGRRLQGHGPPLEP